jgi:hypothetical protein
VLLSLVHNLPVTLLKVVVPILGLCPILGLLLLVNLLSVSYCEGKHYLHNTKEKYKNNSKKNL